MHLGGTHALKLCAFTNEAVNAHDNMQILLTGFAVSTQIQHN